jgi:hypothetical protein
MGLALGPSNWLKIGDHAAFCDVCGFRFHASELRKRWDGCMSVPKIMKRDIPRTSSEVSQRSQHLLFPDLGTTR